METVLEHLKRRHLDVELHRPMVDEVERVATFYLWTVTGKLVGYQQYRPEGLKKGYQNPREGKYFTYHKQPVLTVWGVESLHLSPGVVFLTEGVFDACRLTERGYSSLAVLSCDQRRELRDWLDTLGRKVVAVCDNDASGRKLAKFGDVAVTMGSHDLGDCSDEEVTKLLKEWA